MHIKAHAFQQEEHDEVVEFRFNFVPWKACNSYNYLYVILDHSHNDEYGYWSTFFVNQLYRFLNVNANRLM